MMFILDCDRAYLYGHPERELTPDESARYAACLQQRSTGLPAQYITGHQEFWGMDLIVSPEVLIPRPETEHVLEKCLELIGRMASSRPRIVDVGTGSGCIALALAKEIPAAQIEAVDISGTALEIARANASRQRLDHGISFRQSDLLSDAPRHSFDLVVSNPPYVGESEEDQVQLEVRKFEPRNAVFAGRNGTEVIERLIPQARQALKPGGWLVMEISGSISAPANQLLAGWEDIETTNDLQSIPRVLSARNA